MVNQLFLFACRFLRAISEGKTICDFALTLRFGTFLTIFPYDFLPLEGFDDPATPAHCIASSERAVNTNLSLHGHMTDLSLDLEHQGLRLIYRRPPSVSLFRALVCLLSLVIWPRASLTSHLVLDRKLWIVSSHCCAFLLRLGRF